MNRPTPRQDQLIQHIRDCGGSIPSMKQGAEAVAPNGSLSFGYRTVHRAIAAGKVRVDPDHPMASKYGHGALVLS